MESYHILMVGNAIVDILSQIDDSFLQEHSIAKGRMELITKDRAEMLYAQTLHKVEMSGGSAANSAAAFANLGGKVAFIGKVADDPLGKIYRQDLRQRNVGFFTEPLKDMLRTGRSMVFTTSDGERSMQTYLGAATSLGVEDISPVMIDQVQLLYLEGYLWDSASAKEAMYFAIDKAEQNGKKIALSLSDPFCVSRYREEFSQMVLQGRCHIIFCNEEELQALYPEICFSKALKFLQNYIKEFAFVTRGSNGSYLVTKDSIKEIPAYVVRNLVDTTGAGDLYAAGVLYGYMQGWSLEDSCKLGSFCGAEIVQQLGPKLPYCLRKAAQEAGFIV